jgi:hypothetical protein
VNLADAAEAVLRQSAGEALDAKEITKQAIDQGLISPRSETPWTHLAGAIRTDNRRNQEQGKAARFIALGGGRFQLAPKA